MVRSPTASEVNSVRDCRIEIPPQYENRSFVSNSHLDRQLLNAAPVATQLICWFRNSGVRHVLPIPGISQGGKRSSGLTTRQNLPVLSGGIDDGSITGLAVLRLR
jgi:hypothetical protein